VELTISAREKWSVQNGKVDHFVKLGSEMKDQATVVGLS